MLEPTAIALAVARVLLARSTELEKLTKLLWPVKKSSSLDQEKRDWDDGQRFSCPSWYSSTELLTKSESMPWRLLGTTGVIKSERPKPDSTTRVGNWKILSKTLLSDRLKFWSNILFLLECFRCGVRGRLLTVDTYFWGVGGYFDLRPPFTVV